MKHEDKLILVHNLLELLNFRDLDKLKAKYNIILEGTDKRDALLRAELWRKCSYDINFMNRLIKELKVMTGTLDIYA